MITQHGKDKNLIGLKLKSCKMKLIPELYLYDKRFHFPDKTIRPYTHYKIMACMSMHGKVSFS